MTVPPAQVRSMLGSPPPTWTSRVASAAAPVASVTRTLTVTNASAFGAVIVVVAAVGVDVAIAGLADHA